MKGGAFRIIPVFMDLYCSNCEQNFLQDEGGSRNCPLCDSTLWVTEEPLTEVVTEENHRWIPNVLMTHRIKCLNRMMMKLRNRKTPT